VSQLFEIDVDYYHMPQRSGMRESDFERASLHWSLPAERAALVLVDMWNEHYVLSHLERGGQITRERIVPLAQAFRDAGATVVHAPSPDCLHRYEQRLTRVEGTPAGPAVPPRPEPLLPDWPPAEFRRKEGEFAGLGKPRDEKDAEFDRIIAERRTTRTRWSSPATSCTPCCATAVRRHYSTAALPPTSAYPTATTACGPCVRGATTSFSCATARRPSRWPTR
jgi:hypothetical protein